jgi:hypothetical protein
VQFYAFISYARRSHFSTRVSTSSSEVFEKAMEERDRNAIDAVIAGI